MEIRRCGSRSSQKGPEEYFTGTVRVDPLFEAADPARARGASVTFEPGARTAWHTHPLGQTLIVSSGVGEFRNGAVPSKKSDPEMSSGSSPMKNIGTPPARRVAMTHIAIQEALNGKVVDWMEKVSDEPYDGS